MRQREVQQLSPYELRRRYEKFTEYLRDFSRDMTLGETWDNLDSEQHKWIHFVEDVSRELTTSHELWNRGVITTEQFEATLDKATQRFITTDPVSVGNADSDTS